MKKLSKRSYIALILLLLFSTGVLIYAPSQSLAKKAKYKSKYINKTKKSKKPFIPKSGHEISEKKVIEKVFDTTTEQDVIQSITEKIDTTTTIDDSDIKYVNFIDFNNYEYLNKIGTVYRSVERVASWDEYRVSLKDMSLDNWKIIFPEMKNKVSKKQSSTKGIIYDGISRDKVKVLTTKIVFPNTKSEALAVVAPKFKIIEYNKEGRFVNVKNGVLPNVAQLQQILITINTNGETVELILKLVNENNVTEYIDFGKVSSNGWKTISWENPDLNVNKAYLKQALLKKGIIPYKRFEGFMIKKPANSKGGEYTIEFQNIKIAYQKAFQKHTLKQLDKEERLWLLRKNNAKLIRDQRLQEYNVLMSVNKPAIYKDDNNRKSASFLLDN